MNKVVLAFLVLTAAGIAGLLFLNFSEDGPLEVPLRIPPRQELVPAGTATTDIIKTSDETRIPELMQPTQLVRGTTMKLLQEACPGGTDRCKLQAIYDFVRTNYEHTQSTMQHTYIQAPDQTLLYGQGDGLELALLLSSMQRAAGFESEILIGPYHTFVRVRHGGEELLIDPSCQGCRFMGARVSLNGNEKIYA